MQASFAVVFLLAGVSGFPKVWKIWIPNTNFDSPSNWRGQRLPGPDDCAVFPPDLELGVTLRTGNTVLRKLVLSNNGELFLPNTGALTIKGGLDKVGQDFEWIRRGVSAWLDPSNWRDADADNIDALIPHVERLPCSADTVVFPANSSFGLRLPEVPVEVGTVQLGVNGEITNAEWKAFLSTETGFRQFIGTEEDRANAVTLNQQQLCLSKGGCECGKPVNHSPDRLLSVVCGYARKECLTDVPCYSPIKPVGHCCDVCGGYLLLDVTAPQFDLDALRQRVKGVLTSGEYPGVSGHVGKTAYGQVQVVLVDRQYDEQSVKLAAILAQEIRDSKFPGVLRVTTHTSGPRALGSRWAAVTSTMFGTLVAVVACMGLVYLLFVVHPPGTGFARLARFQTVAQPFRFARFENLSGEGEAALQLGDEVQPDDGPCDPTRQAFDNPLYGQAKGEAGGQGFGVASEEVGREVTHENPIYSELQRKEDIKEDEKDDEDEDEEDGETDEEGNLDEVMLVEQ